MKLRNSRFAAAFDYLRRTKGIKKQKNLAEMLGVNENTVSRILKDYTDVSEDIISRMMSASDCEFNIAWLRGEDGPMLAKDVIIVPPPTDGTLDAKNEVIESLRRELSEKDRFIEVLEKQIRDKDEHIADLKELIAQYRKESRFFNGRDIPFPTGVSTK